ncbi:hypothetical protein [Paenibacillus sp. PAMC21692]|uniref:hypothetical protein n=1 Tax=Paenibacillus sp. PAMC21692 TaxID=2762320 RepID=UPI00164D01DD|nr:hypothetical protein [Paenibacillus sp. PAMC21692]QNK58696.1 hypothetical protein H7F31_07405 [Paenibacillus sp. PAMC21692]
MATDMRLLYDTISMLRHHIESDTAITLDAEDADEWMKDMIKLLHMYNITASRKMTLLGCYVLLRLAVRKHRELALHDNAALTRSILEGDYLFGLYYRFGIQRKEWKLLYHLAPFYKKMQISLHEDKPLQPMLTELREELHTYLEKHCA